MREGATPSPPSSQPAISVDDPPTLFGSPYNRAPSSLGTTRHAVTPVPDEPFIPASFEDWLAQTTMTGNWGGERVRLQNEGINIFGHYLEDSAGNPIGGRGRTVQYA